MFLAMELYSSRVYILSHVQGLLKISNLYIDVRKIAQRDNQSRVTVAGPTSNATRRGVGQWGGAGGAGCEDHFCLAAWR